MELYVPFLGAEGGDVVFNACSEGLFDNLRFDPIPLFVVPWLIIAAFG
jgi:hypothetical protein